MADFYDRVGGTDCICPICNRSFHIMDKDQWVYKRDAFIEGRRRKWYLCSWGCCCKFDKNPPLHKKLNVFLSEKVKHYIEKEAKQNSQTIGEYLDYIFTERMMLDAEEERYT